MKKAAIYIFGLPALDDKPEAQITVHYNDEKKLMAYLKELQKGYCLDGERPRINKLTHPKTGFSGYDRRKRRRNYSGRHYTNCIF